MFRTFYQHFYSSIPPWNWVAGYNIWYTWAYRTGAGCNGCGSIWRCCWIIIFFAVPWANLPCVWIHCITPFQASLSWSQPSYGMYQEKRALKYNGFLQKNNHIFGKIRSKCEPEYWKPVRTYDWFDFQRKPRARSFKAITLIKMIRWSYSPSIS